MFDYTADGVRRSTEDSLQRMGVSRLDIVFVHDISSDNKLLPTPWEKQFAIALKGAFPALSRMREEGIIEGWGIGVNTPGPILRVFLLAASLVIDDPRWIYSRTYHGVAERVWARNRLDLQLRFVTAVAIETVWYPVGISQ